MIKHLSLAMLGGTIAVLFLMACAGMMFYPETPMGKAAFFNSSYHKLVDQYNTEAATITAPSYKTILEGRRVALANAHGPIRSVSNAVKLGQPITVGMLDSVNLAMAQIKEYLLARQSITPSDREVEQMMVRARFKTDGVSSQGYEGSILVLIELIQAMYPLWQQLNLQAGMTPEQLQAEFEMQHAWIMGFNPLTDLVSDINSFTLE